MFRLRCSRRSPRVADVSCAFIYLFSTSLSVIDPVAKVRISELPVGITRFRPDAGGLPWDGIVSNSLSSAPPFSTLPILMSMAFWGKICMWRCGCRRSPGNVPGLRTGGASVELLCMC